MVETVEMVEIVCTPAMSADPATPPLAGGELILSFPLYYPLLGLLNGHPSSFFVFSFKLACLVS